jgi:RNA polymerase sigma factor (sigma-70 family)
MHSPHAVAREFEPQRARLRAIAHRMLGSWADADDAVQQTWLRAGRTDLDGVDNVAGWLTTVTSRVCLDMLRARRRRAEHPLAGTADAMVVVDPSSSDPAQVAALDESVSGALLVVLDRLSPAQRVAFVLHDLFAVPFEQVAAILDRSTVATKKLASRARARVHGATELPPARYAEHRALVEAFLAAARGGDIDALLELLAPGVVRRADAAAVPAGVATVVEGAEAVAAETRTFAARARAGQVALVDGVPGIVIAPEGRLFAVIRVAVSAGRVTLVDVIAEPDRLGEIPLGIGHDPAPGGRRFAD